MKQEPTEAARSAAVGIPALQGREDVNPYPPGTHVIYEGQLAYYRGDTVTVLGPCDCRRCPCQEPDCLPHAQPHYELGDERGDVVMAHARHSNLRPARPAAP